MGLCSVAGMLELQETLDFLIFQVLSLIIGSTLPDSENIWTPTGPTQTREVPKRPLGPYIERETHHESGIYLKCEKNESFKIWGTKKASLELKLSQVYLFAAKVPSTFYHLH